MKAAILERIASEVFDFIKRHPWLCLTLLGVVLIIQPFMQILGLMGMLAPLKNVAAKLAEWYKARPWLFTILAGLICILSPIFGFWLLLFFVLDKPKEDWRAKAFSLNAEASTDTSTDANPKGTADGESVWEKFGVGDVLNI